MFYWIYHINGLADVMDYKRLLKPHEITCGSQIAAQMNYKQPRSVVLRMSSMNRGNWETKAYAGVRVRFLECGESSS